MLSMFMSPSLRLMSGTNLPPFVAWNVSATSGFGQILDVARCYLWLFTLYINIKIGKNSC